MTFDVDYQKLELAMKSINKQYGEGSVIHIGNDNVTDWPFTPTGALTLDAALGIGGLPSGRITEVYGPESSGKSSVALSVVAEAQKAGKMCAYIDVESALDPIYMRSLGVNLDDLILSQPDYGEQALDIVEQLIKTGVVNVIVVDSVAALTPKAELEASMEKESMGLLPKMMSKALRKLTPLVREHDVTLIFINQIREKMGVMFGSPETQPGGRALKFAASVRLDVRRTDTLMVNGEAAGIRVKAKVIKNKMAPPFKTAEYDIIYGEGIDKIGCLLDMAIVKGIIEKSGAWIKFEGESFAQGREKAILALKEDEEFRNKVLERLNAK